jgi:2-oxoglutarate ferredoxin oxidoreductase subunit alpha
MVSKFISGNEAIVEGALAAGIGFFASYPITPASEIMEEIVKHKEVGFIQAEDEIAAINMTIGASLAGKKSMTATSGPGFSLKQESIGFAYKIGVPLVIVDAQRVGPSTGMPTIGAQGDILQAKHGSHGDYVMVVFYPNSVEECYKYSIEAMNFAEEALMPVILLTDGMISHLYENVSLDKIKFGVKERDMLPFGRAKRHFTGLTSNGDLPDTTNALAYREWYVKRKSRS